MRSQLKKKIDYDSFHDEDESFAGRFKIVAIACGGVLLFVALSMIAVMFIAIFSGATGTR
ncbi:MAG: hypothetical protein F4X72_04490 [Dehalococcoidia bacterium]|nr:hypothetical protein [Dehalococcoidia bacterium]